MIVDDEDGPRESLRYVFKNDYDLLTASNGREAVELVQSNEVDVVLLDIRMQGMSGIEVLDRLKYVDPDIEVVMMTAFETTDTLRQALRLHAADYIHKPFDLPVVRGVVSSAMERRRLAARARDGDTRFRMLESQLRDQRMEEEKARTRSDIYASVIHDMNGPLAVISGFVQLMLKRVENAETLQGEDLNFMQDRLKTIQRQVSACIQIGRRYRSLLGEKCGEASEVDINDLLRDFEHLARMHPSKRDHELRVSFLDGCFSVQMNGTDMIQILMNLVANAFQSAASPIQVEVEGRVASEPIALSQLCDGEFERTINVESFSNDPPILMLTVRDTGPGIPADVLPQIFRPYYTTKRSEEGTGLGMSIILRLIKEANGVLHVRTQPGEGTTFTVYLPVCPASDPR